MVVVVLCRGVGVMQVLFAGVDCRLFGGRRVEA